MISEGAFWSSVNESILLSNKLSIIKLKGNKKGKYSDFFLENVHTNDYISSYESALQNYDFEILLKDESFFQFSFRNDGYSMAFFPRPSNYVSFDEWLSIFFSKSTNFDLDEFERFKEEILAEGDSNSEYEQYIIESELSKPVVPIRIDFDPINYSSIYHPLCHMHIGTDNNIRIALDKFITPIMFFQFVIKNYYPKSFFYADDKGIFRVNEMIKKYDKSGCIPVPSDKFIGENFLMFFT